ncbi:MAG: FAD-binding oxidoreductase [Gemmatimonadetes bacterium]|nr:MAG: FAD-binding oxidoreductase [Gemmatimonadota bacterium]
MSDEEYRHKWWGWGPEGHEYHMDGRPDFWAWICKTAEITDPQPTTPHASRESIILPPRRQNAAFEQQITEQFQDDQVHVDDNDRIAHSYGRSYRDLVRLRAGIIDHPPDMVLYPHSHEDVERVVELAVEHDVCLIPFGGGTNIVGCVEPTDQKERMAVTLDMRRMDRLLNVDRESMTADLQPGMFGPQIEEALNQVGLSLGHHPDSFVYSTLGGWLATRSAGTQSNAYGKIEHMVIGMRVVTPTGTVETKPVPAASTGPDLNQLIVGSEGTLGVITQATMRVHPVPEFEDYRLLLFPSFDHGYQAILDCVHRGWIPSLARLSDERETELMFVAKRPVTGIKRLVQKYGRRVLKLRGYGSPAALVVAFEGSRKKARQLKREVLKLCRRHRGFDLGTGPGEAWKESRYDVPYLRDYLMDYGAIADSFETSTAWSNLMPLHRSVTAAIKQTVERVTGRSGYYLGCHISHLYETGACLYYTLAVRARDGSSPEEMIEQFNTIKRATTDEMMRCGGALSHHHAVGYEHQPWIEQELSTAGVNALRAVKQALDPSGILNPGSLIPPK